MKKLLVKILPKNVIRFFIKNKYKEYNIKIHHENINKNKIVIIACSNHEKYSFLKEILLRSFSGKIKVNQHSFYFHPIAIIKTPDTMEKYLQEIGAKSRNMNKKALKNTISTRIFDWNSKLDNIYAINISSTIRQGREMDKSYKEYPTIVQCQTKQDFKIVHIGAFGNESLIGYIELYIYGNFAMINRILGHKEYLKYGVMNLMIKQCVEYAIENKIKYINYLTMQNRKNNSLSAFKYRVGFREYSLEELK